MHTGIFQETLRCALTKPEVASRATEMAIVQKQIEDNETEAKATADAFKQTRKIMEAERRTRAREVREESTFRPVECIQRFEDGMIQTVRTDTGEVVADRPATESEKQTDLFERGLGCEPDDAGDAEPEEATSTEGGSGAEGPVG